MSESPKQRDFASTNRTRRLRKAPTKAEAALWKLLRELPSRHFRRQLALGPFVYDFGDHGSKLLIEVDGGVHDAPDVALRDQRKTEWAESQGYRLIRLANETILREPDFAIAWILRNVSAVEPPPTSQPPPHKGEEEFTLPNMRESGP